jgi:aminoglycoside phosphotransferase family enzyme/predicted kinase
MRIDAASLLDPACYPHPITHLQLRETPLSWVLLTGTYAYKIKKPVRLDFIDASTLQRRRFLCEEELRLNRRFAPDLYRDVVAIGEEHGHLRVDISGTAAEYAVRMHEFDASQELGSLLARSRVRGEELAAFGARLAQWHRAADVAADAPAGGSADAGYATTATVRAQALDNLTALRRCLGDIDGARLEPLARWTERHLQRLEPLLPQRRRAGRVRECHGDLHSGNIVRWHGQLLPFDCLEFEPQLRWIDTISDVAFLFMDLLTCERADLAHTFVSAYLESDGDYDGLRLLRFYALYRALVRAKVDALALTNHSGGTARTHRQRLDARLRTAEHLAAPASAALVLMHGVAASGKSWLSERLVAALPALRVRSDLERKRLPATQFPDTPGGRYCAAATDATYTRLLECAASGLQDGHCMVVDATFLDRSQRARFQALAQRLRCPWLIVACTAARATLLRRLAGRIARATDASEATAGVLEQQLRALQPLQPQERAAAVEIDMDAPAAADTAVTMVRQRLCRANIPSLFVGGGLQAR